MKKFIKIAVPVIVIALGILAGRLIYTRTGIVDLVENRRKNEDDKDIIARINDRTLTENEGRAYLLSLKNQVETIYGEEIWDYVLGEDGTSYEDMLKDRLFEKLVYIKLVCSNAEAFDVELSSDDLADISTYVTDFFAGISEDTAEKYELTIELMTKIYSENVLAEKVYDCITLNHDVNANEENCRQADFLKLEFKKYYLDEDNEPVFYSESEQADIKAKAAAAHKAIENTAFEGVALSYDPESDPAITCGADDLPIQIADKVMALKEGELSPVLESPDAWYIFYCVSENNADATRQAIQKKINTERDEYFKGLYEGWYESASIERNEEKWEKLDQ